MILKNSLGLSFEFLENGSLKSLQADRIRISLKSGTPFSKPGANLYLRKRGKPFEFTALLGPQSNSSFKITNDAFVAAGRWAGLDYTCMLQLSNRSLSWQWRVEVTNHSGTPMELDLIYLQDAGLKPVNAGLINEYYVSQYLERRLLKDSVYGVVACCRQNMKEATGHPWFMLACKNGAHSGSTDGMQFYGRTCRETGIPESLLADHLGGEYAGESSVFALQETPFTLQPGASHATAFVGTYLPDHPDATAEDDLKRLPGLSQEFESVKEIAAALPGVASSPVAVGISLSSFGAADEVSVKNKSDCGRGEEAPTPTASLPPEISPAKNFFDTATFLPVEDLNEAELNGFFGNERRHAEQGKGCLLSFFTQQNHHVMLRAKEVMVDRPHGHIMQSRAGYVPDESIMSTTAFAFGAFNSHLTQGNTNFNVVLSICTSQFNLAPETGQRIFVEIDGQRFLLGVPSAFEMGLNHCRWIYRHGDHCFQARSWTSKAAPQINMDFKVLRGTQVKLLITHDFDAANGWTVSRGSHTDEYVVKPSRGAPISSKYSAPRFRILANSFGTQYRVRPDEARNSTAIELRTDSPGIARASPSPPLEERVGERRPFLTQSLNSTAMEGNGPASSLFVLDVDETSAFCVSFIGEVCSAAEPVRFEDPDRQWFLDCEQAQSGWKDLSCNLSLQGDQADVKAICEILPWYGQNALTHFLTPYGLEQFGGAAWGTRDVSQGPIDLLLNLQKYDAARQVLCTIFSNQEPDGGWPQWWMFDRYRNIRAGEAHGDIHYWCLIALADYIKITGDRGILEEVLPYYHEEGPARAESTPLREHVDRLIKMIVGSFIPGTAFVPFDGGDWNDSLQPVSKELAKRMVSSWTVEMNYQAFSQYQAVYEQAGEADKARKLQGICENIKTDFNRHLIKDGVVAGYGVIEADHSIRLLLHPTDNTTGIGYSILPMNRGIISGIFTEEQARHHQDLIEAHLKGPDGARLMDRPLHYKGGIQTIFQRAESSTFFGREIGLMYMHEHLRYAESLALTGKAEAFLKALRQGIPVAYREIVPNGDIRQANCYYTSSDVAFRNRYEADERYDEIKSGKLTLRGGWRVYSSGPGIYIGLIVSHFLGLRIESGKLVIDPVMPRSMDGLSARLDLSGRFVTWKYIVKEGNFSPKTVLVNGQPIALTREETKYRAGGGIISLDRFLSLLNAEENTVEVRL
jgi:cellobiose phosphorylase